MVDVCPLTGICAQIIGHFSVRVAAPWQPKRSGKTYSCGELLEPLRNWKWIPDDVSAS
jgi:hypothetical protein